MPYSYILFPGRHHLLTWFQHTYLTSLYTDPANLRDIAGKPLELADPPTLVWAITSANHENTRRNPLPGHRRALAIERFSATLPFPAISFHLDDVGTSNRFADHVLKDIEVQSRGVVRMTPRNTVVACSTPSVIDQYEALGFRVLPVELTDLHQETVSHRRPWELLVALVAAGKCWREDPLCREVHPATLGLLQEYQLTDLLQEIFADPLLGEEGDITETRDYATYRQAFDEGAQRKYEQVSTYIRPGRVVDVGCADGAILKLMSEDERFWESDLYGVEVARPLYNYCRQRQTNGDFKNENVFFYQRNILAGRLFPPNSVDTTTTFSLTHEIESYLGRMGLKKFLREVYRQLRPGGVYINLDVVGPKDGEMEVYLWCSQADGVVETSVERAAHQPATPEYLQSLSTWSRFQRFVSDYRRAEGEVVSYRLEERGGRSYAVLRLRDAVEFMTKKDYTDSWYSEMHERFCFWSYEDWVAAVESVGFAVHPDSGPWRNDWIVENRWKPSVRLYRATEKRLQPLPYPPTTIRLVAEKVV